MKSFFGSKDDGDKVSAKAFKHLVLTSIIGLFVCIACLCSTTYAWFVDVAPSSGNELKIADECRLSVTVSNGAAELTDISSGVWLEAGVEYTVTLSLPANSSSGYCIVNAGLNTYYSDYIAHHTEPVPKTSTFTLTVATSQTVKFITGWGIYSGSSDVTDGVMTIS